MSTNPRSGRGFSAPHSNRSGSNAAQRRPGKNGNAKASYEKYVALARAAALTGDAVETENYYQHAEHYFRLMKDERIATGLGDSDSQKDGPVSKGAINRTE
jgi:Domain of unknown function (DUF4167)